MNHFITLPAVKPTVLTEEQRDSLSALAARFRRAYPELDSLTAPFDAEASQAETLKVYQKINGCPHPEACDCFLTETIADSTSQDLSF